MLHAHVHVWLIHCDTKSVVNLFQASRHSLQSSLLLITISVL